MFMTNLLLSDFSSKGLVHFESTLIKKDKENIEKAIIRYSSDRFIHYLLLHY